jgi:signal transduction histidine kinase
MNISKKLTTFVIILIIIPMVLFTIISETWGKKHVQEAQVAYLGVIMQAVRGEMQERRNGMQRICSFLADNSQVQNALVSGQSSYLNERLLSLKRNNSYVDYAVVVNRQNQVVASLSPDSNYVADSPLWKMTKRTLDGGGVVFSEEKFQLGDLFVHNTPEYAKFMVQYQDDGKVDKNYLQDVLTSLIIVPVVSNDGSNRILGAIIVCDVMNNDENFPHYVSANVTGSILTLGVDGTRIASNIPKVPGGNIIGTSFKRGQVLGKTSKGDTWGTTTLNGISYVFLDEPIFNDAHQQVGLVGVGVATDKFYNIIRHNDTFIVWIALVCLVLMLISGSVFGKWISRPIVEATNLTKEYCYKNFPGQLEHIKSKDEGEILLRTFQEFTAKLDADEEERQIYLATLEKEYAKQKELSRQLQKANDSLELTVMDRTAHLQNLVDELRSANKKKALFVAGLTHELRTPLDVILGSAKVLEDNLLGKLTSKQLVYVQSISDCGKHLLHLVNDMLDLSKLVAGKIRLRVEEFSVPDLLETVVQQMHKYSREKDVQIIVTCVPEEMVISADVQKVRQILYNLLSNSVKFTDAGGTIRINARQENELVFFTVQDSGCGIPLQDQERVFKEFEQVEEPYTRKHGGTGLGLPIVKRLVELHGGWVQLKSKEGEGTEITFTIPCDTQAYLQQKKFTRGNAYV